MERLQEVVDKKVNMLVDKPHDYVPRFLPDKFEVPKPDVLRDYCVKVKKIKDEKILDNPMAFVNFTEYDKREIERLTVKTMEEWKIHKKDAEETSKIEIFQGKAVPKNMGVVLKRVNMKRMGSQGK